MRPWVPFHASWSGTALIPRVHHGFLVVDANVAPGGWAGSVITREGFVFDYGGHVLFAHPHDRAGFSLVSSNSCRLSLVSNDPGERAVVELADSFHPGPEECAPSSSAAVRQDRLGPPPT